MWIGGIKANLMEECDERNLILKIEMIELWQTMKNMGNSEKRGISG